MWFCQFSLNQICFSFYQLVGMPTYDDNNKVETKGKYIFIEDKN